MKCGLFFEEVTGYLHHSGKNSEVEVEAEIIFMGFRKRR